MKDVRLRLLTSLILGVPMLGACGGEGDPQGTPEGVVAALYERDRDWYWSRR
jgi:hypothetical protein